MILTALLLQLAAPAAEAADLGKQVAASGALARMIPLIAQKETDELLAAHAELTAAERDELRRIARDTAFEGRAKLVAVMGPVYARTLSAEDMRAIVAFNESAAALRWKAAEPEAMKAAASALAGLDFKGDVLKTLCANTGKACATAK